jgi:peroxiredoxin
MHLGAHIHAAREAAAVAGCRPSSHGARHHGGARTLRLAPVSADLARLQIPFMRSDDLYSVPPNLPVPVDDGACDHLPGMAVPPIELPSTNGSRISLAGGATRWTVVYAYPRTGVPDQDSPPGWDEIPGARGCTPQNCAFRDHYAELQAVGATVYGLSTQDTAYQREMAARLHLPYPILSDEHLELTRALGLPTFQYGDWTLIKRLSLIMDAGRIAHVIYPVFPSNADAPAVVAWLHAREQRR